MKNKTIILLVFLCIFSFAYGKTNNTLYSSLVAQAIGHEIGYENYSTKNNISIDAKSIQNKIHSYFRESGFKLKIALVSLDKYSKNKIHYIEGDLINMDRLGRTIQTKFKANYTIRGKKHITIKNIKLENNSKPIGQFFLVPSNKIDIPGLSKLTFENALEKVNSSARQLGNFNIGTDIKPLNYKFVVFIMSKLNSNKNLYCIFSATPFSEQGEIASSIKTKDGWTIMYLEKRVAYNGNSPRFINLLWQKNGYLIALESYSTQSLIKSIQTALQKKGYNIGVADGRLNSTTKKAINKYLKSSGLYNKSKISNTLLWLMKNLDKENITKIVQATLLANNINVGSIDGQIGPKTIKGIKRYQREYKLKADGKITPELISTLLKTSKNVAIFSYLKNYFNSPVTVDDFRDKIWPNEL